MTRRTLVVTNDFPPRIGGIESFVADVCTLLDHRVVVLTSTSPGAAEHDRGLPFPVVRAPTPTLLPGPRTARQAGRLLVEHGADRVLFGAAAPLALMAPALRRAGARRLVALTHGHERWWAAVPGTRQLLRRIGDDVDALGTISDYVETRIAPALSPRGRAKLFRLPPPVDTELFTPSSRPVTGRRRCIAVGRFVPRKGFGTLLEAWRLVLARWPVDQQHPELVLIGDGPQRSALHRRAASLDGTVRFTGALHRSQVAEELRRAHVFAFPVRDRLLGLDPEGLGLAALEAAASGLPVVVGRSGGAPETVLPDQSGFVLDATDPGMVADRIATLLLDPARASAMGAAGRAYVLDRFGIDSTRSTLRDALRLDA